MVSSEIFIFACIVESNKAKGHQKDIRAIELRHFKLANYQRSILVSIGIFYTDRIRINARASHMVNAVMNGS